MGGREVRGRSIDQLAHVPRGGFIVKRHAISVSSELVRFVKVQSSVLAATGLSLGLPVWERDGTPRIMFRPCGYRGLLQHCEQSRFTLKLVSATILLQNYQTKRHCVRHKLSKRAFGYGPSLSTIVLSSASPLSLALFYLRFPPRYNLEAGKLSKYERYMHDEASKALKKIKTEWLPKGTLERT